MTPGFMLRRLELRGKSREPAILEFRPGLNVVSGASDTGKSYVVQCLDFMFGGGSPPETVPESQGYEQILLTIEAWSGPQFTLERSIKGGDFALHDASTGTRRTLGEKHAAGDDNVSAFLLTLCDLRDKKIRKNKEGKAIAASFRYLSKLILVPEERIFTKTSPFLSGQYTLATAEESLLLLLLSGEDDSSVIHHEPKDVANRRAEIDAQRSLVQGLLEARDRKIATSKLESDGAKIDVQLESVNEAINAVTHRVAEDRELLRGEQENRQRTWSSVQKVRSQLLVQRELQNRFSLLRSHYETDLERLSAVGEAAHYVEQLAGDQCPLCGADPQHQHAGEVPLPELAKSVEAERAKISVLLSDLAQTTTSLTATISTLEKDEADLAGQLAQTEWRIDQELAPASQVRAQELASLLARRSELERMQGLQAEAAEFRSLLTKLSAGTVSVDDPPDRAADRSDLPSHIDGLAQEIEKLLERWQFPIKGRVVFNSDDHDFMIGSRKRASTGKGLRAVSYAAFSVALLRYCRKQNLPHPGLLVLDSPLVAYREKDAPPDETVPADLKSRFYRDLTNGVDKTQFIVLENEHPPEDLAPKIQWTRFTGAEGHGRFGLFPSVRK